MKYIYPAIFSPEDGGFNVVFPDLEGCYTCGDDLLDAFEYAEDALAIVLFDRYELLNRAIPTPSKAEDIKLKKGEFVNYVHCDTCEYQRQHAKKTIKKTLTIPSWLNNLAAQRGINFSGLLKSALEKELGVE